jgi:DNA-binding transcriptional regulator LsrR (DeoR family)
MTTTDKRITIERMVVRKLIRTMKKFGWIAFAVNDGEEVVKCNTEREVIDNVFGVDESWIRFKRGDLKKSAMIVLGNDGYDCIADHSVSQLPDDNFEEIMDAIIYPYCERIAEKMYG